MAKNRVFIINFSCILLVRFIFISTNADIASAQNRVSSNKVSISQHGGSIGDDCECCLWGYTDPFDPKVCIRCCEDNGNMKNSEIQKVEITQHSGSIGDDCECCLWGSQDPFNPKVCVQCCEDNGNVKNSEVQKDETSQHGGGIGDGCECCLWGPQDLFNRRVCIHCCEDDDNNAKNSKNQ